MIYTAQDVVDFLLSSTGGGAQDGEHRAIRQAVIHGTREVLQARNWLWHTKTNTFTATQYSTTATTVTSGSNSVVVASNANMAIGRLLYFPPGYFSGNPRITAINGTTLTLDRNATKTKPVADTVTVLIQSYYDLPADLKDIDALVTNTVGTLHCYLTPQEWQRLEVNIQGAGEPFYYTIMRSDEKPDRWQVRFVGVPTNNTIFHYTYRYEPKMVKYMGYESPTRQGTVTPVAGTPMTITGNGTTFASDMVDSIIRVGSANVDPEPIGALVPYVAQAKITGFTAATGAGALTIEGTLPTTATVKYCVTDIIDCSPAMYTAILSGAEYWYARLAGKPGNDVSALFNRDLRLAMERDVISPLSGQPRPISYKTPRTMGYYSMQQSDQGTSQP